MKLHVLLVFPILLVACASSQEEFLIDVNFGVYEREGPASWWAARPEVGFRVSEDHKVKIQVDPPPCSESAPSELWNFDGDSWNLEASFEGDLIVRLLSESEYVIATDSTGCFVSPDLRRLHFWLTIRELP